MITPMRQKTQACVLFFFLFCLVVSQSSARLMKTKQGRDVELNEITEGGFVEPTEDNDHSFDELMGLEICENGDEECIKRRLTTEVHLDYIYTQHHKP